MKLLVQKVIRRIKNFSKYWHAYTTYLVSTKKIQSFERQPTLQFKLFAPEDVWSKKPEPTQEEIQSLLSRKITLFGHETQTSYEKPRWHDDLRLPPQNNPILERFFSFNIKIIESSYENTQKQAFDIKYPWERSRLQYLLPLGVEFQKNPDANTHLFDFFKEEFSSWNDHNPYLCGTNWMNAMEVGIRAVSLLWLLSYFYTETTSKTHKKFWDLYLTVLQKHATFINNYWEDYDYPNNHYLLNLTAAWFLARFFAHHDFFPFGNLKILWNKVCSGFDAQLNYDGTSYEGSTAYHRLITQSLQHIAQLNAISEYKFPDQLTQKFHRSIQFLSDCTIPSTNTLITIGDDDSGFLAFQINAQCIPTVFKKRTENQTPFVKQYPDFGLTFIMNHDWHISLRTRSFNERSPRGHFHADLLSITLAYQGIPIIIDPGSGCYTANTQARNKLRNWESHSTLWELNTTLFGFNKLFSIEGPPLPAIPVMLTGAPHAPNITAQYSSHGIMFTRSIKLDMQLSKVFITDTACGLVQNNKNDFSHSIIFAPDVQLYEEEPTRWNAIAADKHIVLASKRTLFLKDETLYAKSYGNITSTQKLIAENQTPYHDILEISIK